MSSPDPKSASHSVIGEDDTTPVSFQEHRADDGIAHADGEVAHFDGELAKI